MCSGCLVVQHFEPLQWFDFVVDDSCTKDESETDAESNGDQDMFQFQSNIVGVFHCRRGRVLISVKRDHIFYIEEARQSN